ncbi:MAG: amidohydrolase family protein [Chitinophagales bacterium]|nr:amidohydrolase family protein [Chitinophagales bacterium]
MSNKIYAFICLIFAWMTGADIHAQVSGNPKSFSDTYLLKNYFVIPQPGQLLTGQDILIKKGKIAAIGTSLKAPFDAVEIPMDSMYVYAGFIDAYSHTGIARPEQKDRPKVSDTVYPQNEEAGITPQVHAGDSYQSSDKSVAEMRAAGFTLSNIVPRGFMLPGYADLFNLGDEPGDRMLLKAETAQNFQFTPIRGVYPGTVMGVMAKFRELYKNAELFAAKEKLYKDMPTQYNRPEYSRELNALTDVTSRKLRLFVRAGHTRDVYRAMKLSSELGFDLVLADVKQGWHYLDEIKKTNTGVILSVDLPEMEKTKTDSVSSKKQSPFEIKKAESLKAYLSQAATFEKAGIPFAFSFIDVKTGDIKKNIRTMVENGLSEKAALAALTTYPAQLMGVAAQTGTIEKGKLANLVITNKPYFDEKAAIRYVFVEGKKFEFSEKPKAKDGGKYAGIWSYVVEIPGMTQEGKVTIIFENGEYKISMYDNTRPGDVITAEDISVEGNRITFSSNVNMGQPIHLNFDLTMEDKTYSGTVTVSGFGAFPVKGTWISKPNNL